MEFQNERRADFPVRHFEFNFRGLENPRSFKIHILKLPHVSCRYEMPRAIVFVFITAITLD
jgi:hypothetical protein